MAGNIAPFTVCSSASKQARKQRHERNCLLRHFSRPSFPATLGGETGSTLALVAPLSGSKWRRRRSTEPIAFLPDGFGDHRLELNFWVCIFTGFWGGSAWSKHFTRLHGIFTARLHNDVVPFFLGRTSDSFRIFLPIITPSETFFRLACVNFRSAAAGDPVSTGRHRRRRQKSSHIATETKKNITPSTGGTNKKLSRGSLSCERKTNGLFAAYCIAHTHTRITRTHAHTHTHPSHRQSNAHPTTGPTTSSERHLQHDSTAAAAIQGTLEKQENFAQQTTVDSRRHSGPLPANLPALANANRTDKVKLNALGPIRITLPFALSGADRTNGRRTFFHEWFFCLSTWPTWRAKWQLALRAKYRNWLTVILRVNINKHVTRHTRLFKSIQVGDKKKRWQRKVATKIWVRRFRVVSSSLSTMWKYPPRGWNSNITYEYSVY